MTEYVKQMVRMKGKVTVKAGCVLTRCFLRIISLTKNEELMYLIVQIPHYFLLQCLVTVTPQYTEGTPVSLGVHAGFEH